MDFNREGAGFGRDGDLGQPGGARFNEIRGEVDNDLDSGERIFESPEAGSLGVFDPFDPIEDGGATGPVTKPWADAEISYVYDPSTGISDQSVPDKLIGLRQESQRLLATLKLFPLGDLHTKVDYSDGEILTSGNPAPIVELSNLINRGGSSVDVRLLNNRGCLYAGEGNLDSAMSDLTRAFKDAPNKTSEQVTIRNTVEHNLRAAQNLVTLRREYRGE